MSDPAPVPAVEIRALADSDRAWANHLLSSAWGSTLVVSRGVPRDAADLPGFVAWRGAERAGLLTYHILGSTVSSMKATNCEIVTLNSVIEGIGVGTALIQAVTGYARAVGCKRLWLITTNDNLYALGFYQRRGFRLTALYPDALVASRKLKPGIPLIGKNDIPLRDELELAFLL